MRSGCTSDHRASAAAVSTRRAHLRPGRVRAGGEHAALRTGRTGRTGRWTYTHRRALQATAVVIAALVFVFLSTPTWQALLVIAIVLLIVPLVLPARR